VKQLHTNSEQKRRIKIFILYQHYRKELKNMGHTILQKRNIPFSTYFFDQNLYYTTYKESVI